MDKDEGGGGRELSMTPPPPPPPRSPAEPGVADERQLGDPLSNGVILSNLFEVCGVRELTKLRLVSKSWHDTSLKEFRRRATIRHGSTSRLYKRQPDSDARTFNPSAKYTSRCPTSFQLTSDILKYPNIDTCHYRNFRFEGWQFGKESVGQPFWRQCGAWMTTLVLDHCRFIVDPALTPFFIFTEIVPNLEVLKLLDVNFSTQSYGSSSELLPSPRRSFPPHPKLKSLEIRCQREGLLYGMELSVWTGIIQHFPNLERIQLSSSSKDPMSSTPVIHDEYDLLKRFLQSMLEIKRGDPSKLPVKHLEITNLSTNHGGIPVWIAQLIQELGFSLKSLTTDIGGATTDDVFETLLNSISSTLTKLELTGIVPYPNFPFDMNLDSLQELKLHGPIVSNLVFLKHTPNLRIFECLPLRRREAVVVGMERDCVNLQLRHLTTFNFPLFQPQNSANLKGLAKCMPNLEVISMVSSSETFPELCSLWRNTLRELYLSFGDYCDDGVLTGLSRSSSTSSHTLRLPNVADLCHLQKFGVKPRCRRQPYGYGSQCTCENWKITGFSFKKGFMTLSNLQYLEVFTKEEYLDEITKQEILGDLVGRGIVVIVKCGHLCNTRRYQLD